MGTELDKRSEMLCPVAPVASDHICVQGATRTKWQAWPAAVLHGVWMRLVYIAFQRSWPGLPILTLPAFPPPSTASSCVLLKLCLALQGSCSGPAVHSHQRVCFCAGLRPGCTRVRALDFLLLLYVCRAISAAAPRWESAPCEDLIVGSLEPCRCIASTSPI